MRRYVPRLLLLLAALLVAGGCSNPSSVTSPATPASATTTDTFSGTLVLNGAFAYPFVVNASGGIEAILTTETPNNVQPVGLSLGIWNGTSCQEVLSNDAAIQGTVVSGQTSSSGNFCVRVFDAQGTVVTPESYSITVDHP